MEELQQLIDLLKFEKEKAETMLNEDNGEFLNEAHYLGKVKAFSFCIDEAEKLLKSGREQQPL